MSRAAGARGRGGSCRPTPPSQRISETVYRGLLVAFPADFRRLHGRDAIELFRDRLREARRRGFWRLVPFWGRNVVDVIGQGLAERRASARHRGRGASGVGSADPRGVDRVGAGSGPRAVDHLAAASAPRVVDRVAAASAARGADRLAASTARGAPRSTARANHGSPSGPAAGPGFDGLERWLQGVRFTARNLTRSPVYSAVVIVVFAVTIMAVTTVSSAMESLLWRPLPFPEPERLVFVGEGSAGAEGPGSVTSRYVLDAVRRNVTGLEGLAVFNIWEATLTGVGDPRRLGGAVVSWNYLDTLGVPPILGRSFTEGDGAPGGAPVVVISHRLWQGRFGADPSVVGRRIQLDGEPFEVVGVMPAGLETPDQYAFTRIVPDLWRPQNVEFGDPERLGEPGSNWLRGVARLAPGVGLEQVGAQLEVLRVRIGEQFPRWAEGARVTALPLQHQFTYEMQPVLWILAGAVGLVLLVGNVNVMNLILSRTIDRGREFAIRTALGAGRVQLLTHGVLEALLLALLGGIAGLLLARWSIDALLAASPAIVPRVDAIAIGPVTVAVAMTLTLAAALLAGIVPGLRLLRRDAVGDVSLRSRDGAGGGGLAHSILAVVQLALALTLLVAAGLLTRSFRELLRIDPGFDPDGVYVAQLNLPPARYENVEARTQLTEQLARNLEALTDVTAAGFVTSVPQHGYNNFSSGIAIAGREADPDAPTWAYFRGASRGYFDAMGIRLQRGRLLEPQDLKDGAPTAVIVNEELERRFFDGDSALGATLTVLGQDDLEVVGVVSDVQYGWFGNGPQPETYVPWQGRMFTVFLVVKAAAGSADVAALMKHEVQALDPYLPMDEVWRLEELTADTLAQTRLLMVLMAVLAGFAVLLSAMGTYAVIAHMVARRTAEIGVRMALGAPAGAVLRMVVGRILRIAAVGGVIGLGLAWAGARLLESQLFGVSAHDPLTFTVVSAFLVCTSLIACLQPARRAARVDPVIALRSG